MQSINVRQDEFEEAVKGQIVTQGREILWRLKDVQRAVNSSVEELESNPEGAAKSAGMKETLRMMSDLVQDSHGRAWFGQGVQKAAGLIW